MMRRILSTLALAAFVTAPAAAQPDPQAVNFDFHAPGQNYWDYYEGSVSGTPWLGYNSAGWFQVFCVDRSGSPNYNFDSYAAWATRMDATDLTHIKQAGSAWANYLDAASLASLMIGVGSYNPANFGGKSVFYLQDAIWYAMGYTSTFGVANYNYFKGLVPGDVDLNPANWWVITSARGDKQEFITYLPDPPQELVPEPATMTLLATGLAGMAAARRRRKKS